MSSLSRTKRSHHGARADEVCALRDGVCFGYGSGDGYGSGYGSGYGYGYGSGDGKC